MRWQWYVLGPVAGGVVVFVAVSWYEQALRWGDVVLGVVIGALAASLVAMLMVTVGGLRAEDYRRQWLQTALRRAEARRAQERHIQAQARQQVAVEDRMATIRSRR